MKSFIRNLFSWFLPGDESILINSPTLNVSLNHRHVNVRPRKSPFDSDRKTDQDRSSRNQHDNLKNTVSEDLVSDSTSFSNNTASTQHIPVPNQHDKFKDTVLENVVSDSISTSTSTLINVSTIPRLIPQYSFDEDEVRFLANKVNQGE
jgi:hypothetical protein